MVPQSNSSQTNPYVWRASFIIHLWVRHWILSGQNTAENHVLNALLFPVRSICCKGFKTDCCCWGHQICGEGGPSQKDTESSCIKMSWSFCPFINNLPAVWYVSQKGSLYVEHFCLGLWNHTLLPWSLFKCVASVFSCLNWLWGPIWGLV